MSTEMDSFVKVLVVDDSAFMRKVISDILNSDKQVRVIGTAKNGLEALEKAQSLDPDVITLDVEMPVLDGLSCLKKLLSIKYFPVVMLSSLTGDGAENTIKALEYGAVDFISKPDNVFDISGEAKKLEIIEKVRVAKNAARTKKETKISRQPISRSEIAKSRVIKNIVAIGTSTGGPRALQDVIPLIPGGIPAAFIIVQHMPAGFTKSLADRLNSLSELTVKEAEHGEILKPGYAYVAPGDYHITFDKNESESIKIKLNQEPPSAGHRPSVNVMMKSLSDTGAQNIIGVIMTGMGGDGSEGIKALKNKNRSYIIAQDEKSCVVYGMPRVAVQTGAVDIVVPLKEIAEKIVKFVEVY